MTNQPAPKVTDNLDAWLAENCFGDGFDHNPLLVVPTGAFQSRWVKASGLIEDGRGVHREATFARSID